MIRVAVNDPIPAVDFAVQHLLRLRENSRGEPSIQGRGNHVKQAERPGKCVARTYPSRD